MRAPFCSRRAGLDEAVAAGAAAARAGADDAASVSSRASAPGGEGVAAAGTPAPGTPGAGPASAAGTSIHMVEASKWDVRTTNMLRILNAEMTGPLTAVAGRKRKAEEMGGECTIAPLRGGFHCVSICGIPFLPPPPRQQGTMARLPSTTSAT